MAQGNVAAGGKGAGGSHAREIQPLTAPVAVVRHYGSPGSDGKIAAQLDRVVGPVAAECHAGGVRVGDGDVVQSSARLRQDDGDACVVGARQAYVAPGVDRHITQAVLRVA